MKFLRYPGGKAKLISFMSSMLTRSEDIEGNYNELFVGSGTTAVCAEQLKRK